MRLTAHPSDDATPQRRPPSASAPPAGAQAAAPARGMAPATFRGVQRVAAGGGRAAAAWAPVIGAGKAAPGLLFASEARAALARDLLALNAAEGAGAADFAGLELNVRAAAAQPPAPARSHLLA